MSTICQQLYNYWHQSLPSMKRINDQRHEISNIVVCATSKGSDQPAHTRSMIRALASRLNILGVLRYWRNVIWSF